MQAVLDNINKDTFGSYLDVASSHRLERLEAKCIDYLLANFNKVGISTPSSPDVQLPDLRSPTHTNRACRPIPVIAARMLFLD